MTTEEKLKDYILTKYKSIRQFTIEIGIPYGTMAGIFKRGIDNSSVTNIIKVCRGLNISTDALIDGNIISLPDKSSTRMEDLFEHMKSEITNADNLTLCGKPADYMKEEIVLNLDILLQVEKKRIKEQ